MLVLLSPAKTLDESDWSSDSIKVNSVLTFEEETRLLVDRLSNLSLEELQKILGTSKDIARMNQQRFEGWTSAKEKPCVFMYDGEAFKHLEATSLDDEDLKIAQGSLQIISGLYGLLGPLDLIKPYRLEMATKLGVEGSKNLVQFWKSRVTQQLKRMLEEQPEDERFVVNCASQEYSKAVDFKALGCPVIEIKFPGPAIYAKAARGAMARFCITQRVKSVATLHEFKGSTGDWQYCAEDSTETSLVFQRKAAKKKSAISAQKSDKTSESTKGKASAQAKSKQTTKATKRGAAEKSTKPAQKSEKSSESKKRKASSAAEGKETTKAARKSTKREGESPGKVSSRKKNEKTEAPKSQKKRKAK